MNNVGFSLTRILLSPPAQLFFFIVIVIVVVVVAAVLISRVASAVALRLVLFPAKCILLRCKRLVDLVQVSRLKPPAAL